MIEYRVSLHNPEAHLFQIEAVHPRPESAGQRFTLPAWIPGSYLIRDFAKNIVRLEAEAQDKAIEPVKTDKQSWLCPPVEGPLTVRYWVYAWDLSVRSAHFDTTHAYFNGTSLFIRFKNAEQQPHRVRIERREEEPYLHWRLASSLPQIDTAPGAFGIYQADSYEALIDHPVEIGNFEEVAFYVADTPHRMAITGRINHDGLRLGHDLEKICAEHIAMFGELPPMPEYLFLTTAVGDGYGGLEHKDSCSLLCKRDDLPKPGANKISEGYRRFLGLCSHEYFHLWNVKRIRPQAFVAGGLAQEVHTELLWAFEGITSYYDDLALVRSGVIDHNSWLELLAASITRLMRNRGRLNQSLAESSFDAWTKFYKQDENAVNAIVSYYNKGTLAALCLDLVIRRDTRGEKSLDDVMRALWQRHGKPGIGVPEEGVEKLAMEVTGLDLRGFFDLALRSCDELPLQELLEGFGIGLRLRPAESLDDTGRCLTAAPDQHIDPKPALGLNLGPGAEARVASIYHDSPAQRAGIAAGDQIIAINGLRTDRANLFSLVAEYPVGGTLPIHLFRRDELLEVRVALEPAPADTCDLWLLPEGADQVTEKRKSWLGRRQKGVA